MAEFMAVSPKRQLQELLRARRGGRDAAGKTDRAWFGWRVGDRVQLAGDRHQGEVVEIWNSAKLKVRWDGTGWLSWVYPREVEKLED